MTTAPFGAMRLESHKATALLSRGTSESRNPRPDRLETREVRVDPEDGIAVPGVEREEVVLALDLIERTPGESGVDVPVALGIVDRSAEHPHGVEPDRV